jgi:hypothetical protein
MLSTCMYGSSPLLCANYSVGSYSPETHLMHIYDSSARVIPFKNSCPLRNPETLGVGVCSISLCLICVVLALACFFVVVDYSLHGCKDILFHFLREASFNCQSTRYST